MLLEHYGVKYESDLVLVGFLPNDVIDTFKGVDAVTVDDSGYLRTRQAGRLGGIGRFLYLHSHCCRVILHRYVLGAFKRDHKPRLNEVFKPNGFHENDWRTVEAEYEKIINIARGIGAETLFFHIPHKPPWKGNRSYPAKRLSQWAARNGAPFVDILSAMKIALAEEGQKLYFPEDGHCTPAGYRVIANTLFAALVQDGLVP